MKKVLLFGYYFYPSTEIGAVRISELALRLSNQYKVTVVLKSKPDASESHINENIDFLYIKDSQNVKSSITENVSSSKRSKFVFLSRFMFLHHLKNIFESYNYFRTFVKKYSNVIKDYDYVISSYGPLCNHLCGLYVKKNNKRIKFIADFRDPMNAPIISRILIPYMRFIQNKVCRSADKIIAVSHGYQNNIVPKRYFPKSCVITNGYSSLNQNICAREKFSFFYVGSMYAGTRKFHPLFKVIRNLLDEKLIDESDIELIYAGNDFSEFEKQVFENGLSDYYSYCGKLSRQECFDLEKSSYFLVLSTWNEKKYQGVIPGKLFEYMAFGSKIISICTGDLVNSEVSKIINETRSGFSIEIDTDEKKIKQFILNEYRNYLNGVFNISDVDISMYSYDIIGEKYINIIKELEND